MTIKIDNPKCEVLVEIKDGCDVYSAAEIIAMCLELEQYSPNGIKEAIRLLHEKRHYSEQELGNEVRNLKTEKC